MTPRHLAFLVSFFAALVLFETKATAQTDYRTVRPVDRITQAINDDVRVALAGNRHPLARAEFDRGLAPADTRMDRMVLLLAPDSAQQQALDALVEAQHDPASPEYHQWLTPETYGERFGVSENDVQQVVAWLGAHGFAAEPVTGARRQIVFSGTAAEVQASFHTEIHVYNVRGESHFANASDPEIPLALAEVVSGVLSLHDFRSAPQHATAVRAAAPEFTSGGSHYIAPADFAVIYDVGALYSQSIDGTGQSIAVAGRSDFSMSDVQSFRSIFGLPAKNPTVIVNGTDPGILSSDEQTEATLDVEWSGAVAKGASIQFVVSASTATSDGISLSAQYIVNHNVTPIVSLSFGSCEEALGTSGNQFWNALWQQAAAQGMSVFVAAGDSGAAGCDDPSSTKAVYGRAVNGLCSSPYSTCMGGTQFSDTSNPNAYWSASNSSTYASALSYIPEAAWNESGSVSGGSDLWAGGGGASAVYAKPTWQTGPGVPADGWRDVPDVSLSSASHDGYLLAMNGELCIVGGTSLAAPSFAGLMALNVQKSGARQGNVNPTLYTLAAKQTSGGASVFHDVTTGNNTVPGLTGYNAGVGYDLATGLGSVDASVLVNHWGDASAPATPAFQLTASTSQVSLAQGTSAAVTLTVTVSGGFSSAIAFSAGSLPSGLAANFSPSSLPTPGSGTVTLNLSAGSSLAAASYNLTITGTGGGQSRTVSIALTITATAPAKPVFSLSATSVTFPAAGGTGTVTVSANPSTATWTAASNTSWIVITKGGTTSSVVTYSVAANTSATARSGSMTIAGITFAVNQSAAVQSCTYQIAPGPLTGTSAGASGTINVSTATGCSWTASSNASWLTISSGASGTGNGVVKFLAANNTGTAPRTGVMTVAGYTIDVTEAATSAAKH